MTEQRQDNLQFHVIENNAITAEAISRLQKEDDDNSLTIIVVGNHTRSKELADTLARTTNAITRVASQRKAEISEKNIENLVEIFLEGEDFAQVDRDIEMDNAQLRSRYLKETPAYTAQNIRENKGSTSTNLSEPASRWKREKRIFGIRHKASDLFPQFQFSDGNPIPIITKVLKILPEQMTPWQIAFWFESENIFLDNRAPQDSLDREEDILNTAKRMTDIVIS